mgnify:CR=1 FL=1
MPAKSKSQQRAAGMSLAAKRGKMPKSRLTGAAKDMMMSMSEAELEKMATMPNHLPEKVKAKSPTKKKVTTGKKIIARKRKGKK